jgi:hypothetical protein
MAAAIYRQQKVLSHFPMCCWIDWLLMIKNCLIESGPPCTIRNYQQQRKIDFSLSDRVSLLVNETQYDVRRN